MIDSSVKVEWPVTEPDADVALRLLDAGNRGDATFLGLNLIHPRS